ncbi:MAG: class I SAM-dependent DNA methyltransferase [Solirubrobacteraceae bacterium]
MTTRRIPDGWRRLTAVIDGYAATYAQLGDGAQDLADYLARPLAQDDEETLTERVLADVLEQVLGFGRTDYVPQLSRSGMKPDFTPSDLVAHGFVLDAKSSRHSLPSDASERQIRGYMEQRHLDHGLLFNLREIVVYARAEPPGAVHLRLPLLPLWETAHERVLAVDVDLIERFERFVEIFRFREQTTGAKLERLTAEESWYDRLRRGDAVGIDLEYLVERLRRIARQLEGDVERRRAELEDQLDFDAEAERRLRAELVAIAADLEPGADTTELPLRPLEFAAADDLAARAWRQYVRRVAQLALTRILLHRAWEDVGFVEDVLQDGGLGRAYERFGQDLRRVLDEAFRAGDDRYPSLFGRDHRYDWYRPTDEALVDVLYALLPVPLGRLRADVLGGLYESSVDAVDRDRLGQFYTPRSVVELMLDRVGFSGPDGVFRLRGDERDPVRVWDFSTGSGGFLVEAARRITDAVADRADADDALGRDGLRAVARGLHGTEISPFPYYLTEINLLLQVSRLLALIIEHGGRRPAFTLSVVHTDALATRSPVGGTVGATVPAHGSDERYGLEELEGHKRAAWHEIREGGFDLVVGNPPYVAEANNKVLFDRLRALPAWPKQDVPGKSDYAYFFLAMAVEKLAVGGRMAVITPAGWTNAGNAEWLRGKLLASMRIDEAFLFGGMRLFTPEEEDLRVAQGHGPPTVESLVLVATKVEDPSTVPDDHTVRVVVVEDERAALRDLDVGAGTRDLVQRLGVRADGAPGRRDGVLVHDLPHGLLEAETPWPLKFTSRSVQVRVVRHMDAVLAQSRSAVERLDRRWNVAAGIETGADALQPKLLARLPAETRRALDGAGFGPGTPVMARPPGSEELGPWSDHPEFLARVPDPGDLVYGTIFPASAYHLVWIGRADDPPQAVIQALAPFRAVLEHRAELRRNPDRRWFETAWPRDRAEQEGPKVLALHRTDRGRFAVDERGAWQASKSATSVAPRSGERPSVAYLCGVLNSELLDVWYGIRGRVPRDVWRDYEPKPMARVPYRHVEPVDGWTPGLDVELIHSSVALHGRIRDSGAFDRVVSGTTRRLRGEAALDAQAVVEHLVRAMVGNRTRLLELRPVADGLAQAVRDPWRTHGVTVHRAGVLAGLPDDAWRSARIDPAVRIAVTTDGRIGRGRIEEAFDGTRLVFRHGRAVTCTVEADTDRIALLAEQAGDDRLDAIADVQGLRLPVDLDAFEARFADADAEVHGLLADGAAIVEAIERIVCRLYGTDESLEAAVVAHARRRAERGAPPDGE